MGEGLGAPRGSGLRSRVCVRKAACRPERTGNGTRPLPPPGLRTECGRREETQTARPQPWRHPPRGVSLRRSPGQDVRPLRPAVPIVAPCPLSPPCVPPSLPRGSRVPPRSRPRGHACAPPALPTRPPAVPFGAPGDPYRLPLDARRADLGRSPWGSGP